MATEGKVADLERDADFTPANKKSPTPSWSEANTITSHSKEKAGDGSEDISGESGSPDQNGATTTADKDEDASPEGGRSGLEMAAIMLALCSALFLAALDATIVTTALPTIVGEFKAPSGYTWVGAAYTLASSATVPSWGKVSDIWGRKPVLLLAVGIFWIGSLISALSKNIGQLIAGRAIQGGGGGGVIVLINIAVSDLVSLRKRGQYYGIFGGVWALASAIGPVLGGVFTAKVRSLRWLDSLFETSLSYLSLAVQINYIAICGDVLLSGLIILSGI
jgi:MFS family permease